MKKFRLVVESGADIPEEIKNEYDITVVPMHLTLGEQTYADGTISVEQLIEHYEQTGELPKTSGCSPADFTKVFDELHVLDPDAQLLHLAYSAQTTCSYESALVAAEGRDYVNSLDTKSVSGGQTMIVESIAKVLAHNPDTSLKAIEEMLLDRVKRIRMGFFPDTLTFLHAGGRLSNAAFIGAQILRIKPLIEIIDGNLVGTKKYRGSMAQVVKKFITSWPDEKRLVKDQIYLLCSVGLSEKVKTLAESLVTERGFRNFSWITTGSVVTSHIGPGGFGIVGFAENS